MSRINIQGTIENIRSKSNVYTPVIESIVNSIHAIRKKKIDNGKIEITLYRDNVIQFENAKADVRSIHIRDNGIGFDQDNRDSFDTFYSEFKKEEFGGKGFGRFMFVKYFGDVTVESVHRNEGDALKYRYFRFGREFDIIVDERKEDTDSIDTYSVIKLENLKKNQYFDKQIDTISRRLLEKLLIFFVNETTKCPTIIVQEADGSGQIVLNDYLVGAKEIQLFRENTFEIQPPHIDEVFSFKVKVFKVYYPGSQKSRISLTGHDREVTETNLHKYIPEFEDDFFEEEKDTQSKKNYIIKTYVLGDYLDGSVALEREGFYFEKDMPSIYYPISQADIEQKAAEVTKGSFSDDVQTRFKKKQEYVKKYVDENAPWHKPYFNDLDISTLPYNPKDENIEIELQTLKFKKEQSTRAILKEVIKDTESNFSQENMAEAISKISDIGKSDLAHYVFNRKLVLEALTNLLKRRDDGKAELEKDIHNLIYPMGGSSDRTPYEDHNLWLLDERLVFSEYIASDKKISTKKDALGEPDLMVFDQKRSFRNGDNEFSNPLTIFEFKRPKRTNYTDAEDPIVQIGSYLQTIRAGKHEMPEGLEPIRVNDNTPVYGYVVADITDRVIEFAMRHQLTQSPDREGYFGFHNGYKMYIEILSFKKLLKDATLRNKVFFKKLLLE